MYPSLNQDHSGAALREDRSYNPRGNGVGHVQKREVIHLLSWLVVLKTKLTVNLCIFFWPSHLITKSYSCSNPVLGLSQLYKVAWLVQALHRKRDVWRQNLAKCQKSVWAGYQDIVQGAFMDQGPRPVADRDCSERCPNMSMVSGNVILWLRVKVKKTIKTQFKDWAWESDLELFS